MNKYSICLTETSKAYFVVEANSAEEAQEMFDNKRSADYCFELDIEHELERGYEGCEISIVDALPDEKVDYTYEQLKECEQ